jgi:prepilin-type processing-associated H-X9-DG protein
MLDTPAGYYCGNVCWSEQIQPYVKNFQIFRCPSRPRDYAGVTDVNGSAYQLLYGLPNNGASEIYSPSNTVGCHISKIKEPARTFLVVETKDANWYDGPSGTRGYGIYGPYFSSTMTRPEQSSYYDHDRHLDGSNVAFVDGHVKWVKSGNGNQYIFWNTCNQS